MGFTDLLYSFNGLNISKTLFTLGNLWLINYHNSPLASVATNPLSLKYRFNFPIATQFTFSSTLLIHNF